MATICLIRGLVSVKFVESVSPARCFTPAIRSLWSKGAATAGSIRVFCDARRFSSTLPSSTGNEKQNGGDSQITHLRTWQEQTRK